MERIELKKETMVSSDRIEELERRIAEIKERIPPHSVKPQMLEELKELEEELEKEKGNANKGK